MEENKIEKNEELLENEQTTNDLKQLIEEQNKKLEEQEDRLKRLMAEFENSKKRVAKEKESTYNMVISDIVTNLLPVVDNLEKAVLTFTEDENYKKGIELVQKQFVDVLNKIGVTEIEAVGKPFDPSLHEAVSTTQDETLGNQIVKEELRKGYKIGSKVIRHSMVIVAN